MSALAKTHQSTIQITSFNELMRFADVAANSGMVPNSYAGKPNAVLIAVQMGSELGLAPMQSVQNIAVINGRPSVWGDAMIALVKGSSVCDDVIETFEGEGDQLTAICVAKRKGKAPVEARFSMKDAEIAGLKNKPGPWKQYPKRMLQMRARGFALRDAFPDVLKGLISAEEAMDLPQDEGRSTVINYSEPARTPNNLKISQNKEQDPIQWFKEKLATKNTSDEVLSFEADWKKIIQKRDEKGNPFSDDILDAASDMIADRYMELKSKESQEVETYAQEEIEELPA
ncbi:recombinase RecT [Swingsia samuiensis]|uniref:Recombinase RecT n=1 Tax=Swingsia samuiensis TaxID=1293412 RepID=A0A4Y6UK47_9PROT|nr:recombinase RecT [Swingsia samuiensis]QDH17444.1 hypothetical protein E3D00_07610 [Swingsia samuiensis]